MFILLLSFLCFNFFTVKCAFDFSKCNEELCMYSDGKTRSYVDSFAHCSEIEAWPVEITDLDTSHLFESFMVKYLPNSFVYLNMKIEFGWKWINGKGVDFSKISFDDNYEATNHAAFSITNSTLNILRSTYEDKLTTWICSKSDESLCPKPFVVLDKKCYFVRHNSDSVYFAGAVNDCFNIKATLATFENLDKDQIYNALNSILVPSKLYWVGITSMFRKWRKSDKPVLFGNWLYGKIWYADCITAMFDTSLSRSFWTDDGCNGDFPVVCMKNKKKEPKGTEPPDPKKLEYEKTLQSLVIAGWVVAVILLFGLLFLLACFLKRKNKIRQSNNSVSTRNSLYPIDNPQPISENPAVRKSSNPPTLPKRRSETSEYVENKNYYEIPSAVQQEDVKYTDLVN